MNNLYTDMLLILFKVINITNLTEIFVNNGAKHS